ncbi:uncharacterized protein LOC122880896 [Siniperca chuatsi]|uniref:uncharacterized protein LOC122880896 n=1 Tax=Siniperca chuatsi TaxID=119488 RepID=UPI001CE0427C|nr:uncharacterized protein LOC122880896 [Siniperca chuatsi]
MLCGQGWSGQLSGNTESPVSGPHSQTVFLPLCANNVEILDLTRSEEAPVFPQWCVSAVQRSESMHPCPHSRMATFWYADTQTQEEAEGDHREELYRLHVLNLFGEGQRRVEGMERKCTVCLKWNTRWQEVGRRTLKMTPGLCIGMASVIDPARDGREGSQVPPEGLQTTQIYYGQGGESAGAQPHCSQSYHCSDSQSQLAAS